MKRFMIMVLAVGVLAGSVATGEASHQRTPAKRTVVESYSPYPATVTFCNPELSYGTCVKVQANMDEAFFTAKVSDAHGKPVFVDVRDRYLRRVAGFCGETSRPIAFPFGTTLYFNIGQDNSSITRTCLTNIRTTGTIRVTLSNLG